MRGRPNNEFQRPLPNVGASAALLVGGLLIPAAPLAQESSEPRAQLELSLSEENGQRHTYTVVPSVSDKRTPLARLTVQVRGAMPVGVRSPPDWIVKVARAESIWGCEWQVEWRFAGKSNRQYGRVSGFSFRMESEAEAARSWCSMEIEYQGGFIYGDNGPSSIPRGVSLARGLYAVLWLDNTASGAFSAEGIGHAKPEGESLPFVFKDAHDEVCFKNTFAYDPASRGWAWTMDNVDKGVPKPFGRVKLSPR